MHHTFLTQGTCSHTIEFDIDDGLLHNVVFSGGCHGNLQGIGRLAEGMRIEDVLERLDGIRCGSKYTSCPDQLCHAIRETL